MPKITKTLLPDVILIEPEVHGDTRGFFLETYRKSWFLDMGIDEDLTQHNHSSSSRHVLRGLHYQIRHPQSKLVRVIRGKVWDVAVDVRSGSPTFGQWLGVELSEKNRNMLYIPKEFAHGFFVLSDIAEFSYLCSDYYDPGSEAGVRWNCPELAIDWPIPVNITPVLSEKDRVLPGLHEAISQRTPNGHQIG